MKKIAILSGGAIGLALGIMFVKKHKVFIWMRNRKEAERTSKTRKNKEHLPDVEIPREIVISSSLEEVIEGADLIIIATSSKGIREVSEGLKEIFGRKKRRRLIPLLGLSKGIEGNTRQIFSQIIEGIFGDYGKFGSVPVAYLSIPNFAKYMIEGKPTSVVLASSDENLAKQIQEIINAPPKFKVLLNPDIIGVQLGGILKNILALVVGIFYATNNDPKTRDRLISFCIDELVRVGTALGGKQQTLEGLPGKGDFLSTVSSPLSRNLGSGKKIVTDGIKKIREEIRKKKLTSEGLESLEAIYQLCEEHQIYSPIIAEIYQVVYKEKPPKQAINDLINLVKERGRK